MSPTKQADGAAMLPDENSAAMAEIPSTHLSVEHTLAWANGGS